MEQAGYKLPLFDFQLPGVTSISCDTHKYAYGPKGLSTVIYRNEELRNSQFFSCTDWEGGVYATPCVSGSRSGALVAATWAVMMYHGKEGYVEKVKEIVRVVRGIAQKIKTLFPEDLELVGDSGQICVLAFKSKTASIFAINEKLK